MTVASSVTLPPLPAPGPMPEPKKSSVLPGIAIGVLAGLLVGLTLGKFDLVDVPRASLAAWQKAALVAIVLVTFPLLTLVHELGHLLGGFLAGFRFNMLIWGPFKLAREGERLHLTRNRSLALAGGMALSVPTDTSSGNAQAAMLVAGGPLTSLVVGVALLLLRRGLDVPAGPVATFGEVIAAVLLPSAGLASIGIGLITLVPMRTSGFLTDGARLLRLMRGDATAARDRAMMTLVGLAASPTRPRDWPAALIRDVDDVEDGTPFDAVAPLLAYYHLLDQGRLDAAHAAMVRTVARLGLVPPTARGSYATEFAFHELVVRGDRERARGWLDATAASPFDDRLLRPLLSTRLADHGFSADGMASDSPMIEELARRSGVDRMRVELLRR